ncbi:universal stress protein [Winogradskyella endarachnes]|uniref:Universal stress protein n=1 Tax=Winogradskyella endarachnes TaxID=2681965 RepID=A0A6L6UBL6_9FLAO|nr:universal stress protein [Winogradskyella endarachnes]MUU79690.1 universal stress protein [Winogradskyella endarachnes]
MKTNILIPTDFSDNAWCATVYALKLFKDKDCLFYFFHSTKLKINSTAKLSNKLIHFLTENATKELLHLKDIAESTDANPKHDFEIIVCNNDLNETMVRIIEKNDINLVVMGTKGATKGKEIIFGSNTVKAIRKIKKCPILVVPDEYDYMRPSQIAFPTDFNRLYSEELKPLKFLSDLHQSKIRVIHINKEEELTELQEYNLDQLEVKLKKHNHSFHWMPDYGKKHTAIKDFIDELNINILVMVSYKYSFIKRILREPVIKKIGFKPSIPFLVIPYNN